MPKKREEIYLLGSQHTTLDMITQNQDFIKNNKINNG